MLCEEATFCPTQANRNCPTTKLLSHDVTDGREKDGSRSLKTSHLGHGFDDGYISLTSSHTVRRGLTGASQNELYTGIYGFRRRQKKPSVMDDLFYIDLASIQGLAICVD